MSKKPLVIGCVILGSVMTLFVLAVVSIAGYVYYSYRYFSPVIVIAPAGAEIDIFIDDDEIELKQKGSSIYPTFSMPIGARELVVKQGNRVLLEVSRTFGPDHQYVVYCGGPWLSRVERSYSKAMLGISGFVIPVEIPRTYKVVVDGETREFHVGSHTELNLHSEVFGGSVDLLTRPGVLKFDRHERLYMPGEELPSHVFIPEDSSGSVTRSGIRLLSREQMTDISGLIREVDSDRLVLSVEDSNGDK